MRWSIKIMSYLVFAAIATASAPEVAVSIFILVFLRRLTATVRLILVSSTIRICASGALNDSLYGLSPGRCSLRRVWKSPIGSSDTTFCGIDTVKIEPLPYSLSTSIVPPMRSTRLLVIASPKPVPSTVLLRSISRRSNLLKRTSLSSGLIPIPVSHTVITRIILLSSAFFERSLRLTEPLSVYLTALFKRLVKI